MTEVPTPEMDVLREVAGCAVVATSIDRRRQVFPFGGASGETVFRIASLTKTLTAVATVRSCRLTGTDLNTPVLEVLPDLRGDWAADADVTIADVLSQTSGLAPTVTAEDVSRLGEDDSATVEAGRLVVRAGSDRPRGRSWEYYNGNYFLAGAVTAALMQMSYEEALDQLVLRPWGLATTSFTPPHSLAPGVDDGRPVPPSTYPRGRRPSGGLCSTATDLLTVGERILADRDLLAEVRAVRTAPGDPNPYGLGWALGPSGQMYLNGRLPGYRAAFMLVPEHDLVAVTLATSSEALPVQARILSGLQHEMTGDDLAAAIDGFAA